MGYNNFEEDLKAGQAIEERVISHMLHLNPDMVFYGFSGTKGYDAHFSVNNIYYKLEIKSDYHTVDTGNIVIEHESRGKPSGITTTQANLWAYAVITKRGLDIYLIPTQVIKGWIEKQLFEREFSGGDVRSNTRLYLFKADKVLKNIKKLEETL